MKTLLLLILVAFAAGCATQEPDGGYPNFEYVD